ncbi:hypothetical protein Tco_1108095 [Tanacetum coccineum]
MDNPDITMEEYVWLETERALRNGKEYNWETATYDKIWDDEDFHYLRLFETEFPAKVYNDAWASKSGFSSERTVSIRRKLMNERNQFGGCLFSGFLCCADRARISVASRTHTFAHQERNMEDHTEQILREFLVLILLISRF